MITVLRVAVAFTVLSSVGAGMIWAQGTRASINGMVKDPTGAAVPSAVLNLRSLATSAVVTSKAGSDGLYGFPNLVPGVYELSVQAKGFREYVQKGQQCPPSSVRPLPVLPSVLAELQLFPYSQPGLR